MLSPLVDLHAHVLPAVDDGPTSIDETIALLRAAHAGGVRRLAATPHMFLSPWNHCDPAPLREAFARMGDALAARAAADLDLAFLRDLRIDLGAENYVSAELLEALERRRVLPLNDSRYLLVEFPIPFPADRILAAARRVLAAGLRPVIAHVERYLSLAGSAGDLARLREEGCVLQVNAGTFLRERRDDRRRRHYVELLRDGVVQVVASDSHDAGLRRPVLGDVVATLEKELPEPVVEACLHRNARRILNDEPL
jgi:protein-tyrosine phosphatase